eukprot:13672009-Alexandrium_andersonii.AAC.1
MLKSVQAFEPGTAWTQKRPQMWYPEIPKGGFCAAFRTDAESADEAGWPARRRCFSRGVRGAEPSREALWYATGYRSNRIDRWNRARRRPNRPNQAPLCRLACTGPEYHLNRSPPELSGAPWIELSCGTRKIASGVRTWNCASPRAASN